MTALKRIIPVILCFLLLPGCALRQEDSNGYLVFRDPTTTAETKSEDLKKAKAESELRCCWLSYMELNPKKLLNESDYRSYIQDALQPLTRLGVTDLFVHVRPFADAIYPSDLFESSDSVVERRGDTMPFDYFAVILAEATALHMRVHAWVNPYRILSDARLIDLIDPDSIVGRMIFENNGTSVIIGDSGVWLQPAAPEAQKLILDGARELLNRYHIAGIHIDDYFYPQESNGCDAAWYRQYIDAGGALSLHAWRCEQVNALLRGLYRTVHEYSDKLVFSVSPGGNSETDYASCCADVALWCREPGYCDWMIPQLYYGFQNETMPFGQTAKRWQSLCKSGSVRLLAGLALYKVGKVDAYAGSKGKREWISDNRLVAKQLRLIRRMGYDGFALFSAQFVNFQEKVSAKACQMLERVL